MGEFQEITIALSDGYEAYARYWPAEARTSAVLYLHGIQSHCGWFAETAGALQAAGWAVLQPDRRGSGRNQHDRGNAASHVQLIDDGLLCARRLRELAGVQSVHLLGVSWGGKLAAAMYASDPAAAVSLTLVVPGVFPIIDVPAAEKFRIGWSMVSNPARLFDIPLNDPELFTDQPDRIAFLRDDPYQLHQATAGFFVASRRMDRVCARLPQAPPVPLHVFLAGQERIIDNDRTREWIRRMRWPCRQVTVYDRARHTLEFSDACPTFTADLIRWLSDPAAFVPADSHRNHN
jgi:acylglycerol lipase